MLRRDTVLGLLSISVLASACSGNSAGANSASVGGTSSTATLADQGGTAGTTGGANSGGAVSSNATTGGASDTGGANATGGLTFIGPAPKVAAFNILGAPPAGGGLLLIVGTNLHVDSQVRFGNVP